MSSKTHHTVLAVIPPQEAWGPIQPIRAARPPVPPLAPTRQPAVPLLPAGGVFTASANTRITGSRAFIDAVLSRLTDLLAFENGRTRL